MMGMSSAEWARFMRNELGVAVDEPDIVAGVVEGLDVYFAATISSEELPHGKPAPDVYLEVSRRLGVHPSECAAIEDSTNGLLAAQAAGMRVVAVPRADFPPRPEALACADAVIPSLGALAIDVVDPTPSG
jgi:beta-phosphoglucomutase-like phosphatase (HAD superfamily)